MSNIYRGVGVNWGNKQTTVTGVTGLFTTKKYGKKADSDLIRDGDGAAAGKVYYNPYQEGTFSYVPTGANGTNIVISSVANVGDILTVTDAQYTEIAGTTWLIDDIESDSTNTSATVITYKLSKYAFTP